MSNSAHTFTCVMITLTGALLNFVFDDPISGWVLIGVTAVILLISAIFYKKEKEGKQ